MAEEEPSLRTLVKGIAFTVKSLQEVFELRMDKDRAMDAPRWASKRTHDDKDVSESLADTETLLLPMVRMIVGKMTSRVIPLKFTRCQPRVRPFWKQPLALHSTTQQGIST